MIINRQIRAYKRWRDWKVKGENSIKVEGKKKKKKDSENNNYLKKLLNNLGVNN